MNRHLLNLWKDYWKNPSIKAGEEFEDFVADEFFPDDIYEMLHRTHDVNTNSKRYIRSSLNPDFQFEVRNTNIRFWVECKHRENNYDDTLISVFKPGQLERYQNYENCFLLLCTYRYDNQYMYFVPMWHIKYYDLYLSFLKPYELKLQPPILPGWLKSIYLEIIEIKNIERLLRSFYFISISFLTTQPFLSQPAITSHKVSYSLPTLPSTFLLD